MKMLHYLVLSALIIGSQLTTLAATGCPDGTTGDDILICTVNPPTTGNTDDQLDGDLGNDVITVAAGVSVVDIDGDGSSTSDLRGAGNGYADTITNYGIVTKSIAGDWVQGNGGDDIIYNYGLIQFDIHGDEALGAGGNDTITNGGTIQGEIFGEGGNDTIIITDHSNGGPDHFVRLNGGSGTDRLYFRFSDAALYNQVATALVGKSPAGGSITVGGETYTWSAFEEIHNDPPAGAPPPTNTPTATKTPTLTNSPTPTPTNTPTTSNPTDPSVIVMVDPASANPGDQVEVNISVANLNGLYGLQTQCSVDPNILTGTGHGDGEIFNTSSSFLVDTGFKTGNWTVAASLLQPHRPFSGSGVAYKLNFTVQNPGSSSITCTALAVDANGIQLPAMVINGSFNGANVQPLVVPLAEQPINPPPPSEPPQQPPPTQLSTISGMVAYQNHPDNAGITVQLKLAEDVLATVTTNPDGSYSFTDVPIGTYAVSAFAPVHLAVSKVIDVTADGQSISVDALTLPAGDTDENGTIDLLDAGLIGANFSGIVPPSPSTADLNVDGNIDIRDLALVGGNFGLTGHTGTR